MTKRFFKPFVGDRYQEGINGKKILVVGASFYCDKTECKFFNQCTSCDRKDSSDFDKMCPVYSEDAKVLHEEPSYCVEDAPRTYRNFAGYIAKIIGCDTYADTWDRLAFTNYVQFFLPAKSGEFRETNGSDLSERDFDAFYETLAELQPDVVVIWGCVINNRLRQQNPYVIDITMLDSTECYVCKMRLPVVSHDIYLINPYHPSSSAWFSELEKFDKYMNNILSDQL